MVSSRASEPATRAQQMGLARQGTTAGFDGFVVPMRRANPRKPREVHGDEAESARIRDTALFLGECQLSSEHRKEQRTRELGKGLGHAGQAQLA
jgi:hypothetical protein